MTIVIVEQSLNVALSIADRAVFLEKGQVRFEGSAARARGTRRSGPGRVPGPRGRLSDARDARHPPARLRRVRLRVWCTACWPSASCSSTGPPASSTSRSATWAWSAPGLLVLLTVQYDVPYWLARASSRSRSARSTARCSSSRSSAGCSTRRASSCSWRRSASRSCRSRILTAYPDIDRARRPVPAGHRVGARDRVDPDHRRRSSRS